MSICWLGFVTYFVVEIAQDVYVCLFFFFSLLNLYSTDRLLRQPSHRCLLCVRLKLPRPQLGCRIPRPHSACRWIFVAGLSLVHHRRPAGANRHGRVQRPWLQHLRFSLLHRIPFPRAELDDRRAHVCARGRQFLVRVSRSVNCWFFVNLAGSPPLTIVWLCLWLEKRYLLISCFVSAGMILTIIPAGCMRATPWHGLFLLLVRCLLLPTMPLTTIRSVDCSCCCSFWTLCGKGVRRIHHGLHFDVWHQPLEIKHDSPLTDVVISQPFGAARISLARSLSLFLRISLSLSLS